LKKTINSDPRLAKKLLRKFPSIGEPYADRILLYNGAASTLAPDSNALRVLVRLGFTPEEKSYSKMYKAAVNATKQGDGAFALSAHLLLRRHGQNVCKRTDPMCDACVVRGECAWYRNQRRTRT
jgi:endonuclease III